MPTTLSPSASSTAQPVMIPPPTLYPAAPPITLSGSNTDDSTASTSASSLPPISMNIAGTSSGTTAAAIAATTAIAVAASSSSGTNSSRLAPAQKGNSKKRPYPFALGGIAASVSACCTHPLDLAKNRMQTCVQPAKGTSALSTTQTLLSVIKPPTSHPSAAFQPLALYTGLSASLARQFSYSLVRFGAYDTLKARLASEEEREGTKRMGIGKSLLCASLAGAAGGIAGNPADILLVRMTSDANRPPDKRYNYANAVVGLVRMAREEGLSSYARGLLPNTVRAVLMNASQLATYDVFKDALISSGFFRDGIMLHFTASFCAGTVATTVCSPADVIKARVMSGSSSSPGGLAALRLALQNEGPAFLFRGFIPAWIRLSPNTVITFVTLERLRMMVDWQRDQQEGKIPARDSASRA
ncbi:unnamed protein product [Tilletia controversa]|uniref:Mitochondrial dicarboxylate transporter n=3 Tax=Tilletia TaxID=13289 RepID=A0A8X7SYH2_9BASI|nr:hypothetical protein CF336_g2266 [Tilletia laevis]KAE8202457.1 hypothetical protein CF328_g2206 [Tilletia controversa]KAE8263209.1 hypothetical protein A4X03_0g1849 [Tilletia caries]KAE8208380.1 hypothetical protein CF335_g455 [Tilletia laevis]KAE8251308.1 hypothetical protein A4X06_0g2732 [Tilletia controversa]